MPFTGVNLGEGEVYQRTKVSMKRVLANPLYRYLSYCLICTYLFSWEFPVLYVLTGSPSHGGNVTIYVLDIKQPSMSTIVHSVLVSVSVFMALSTVFNSINSPNNSPLSHAVFQVLFWIIDPFNYISLYESLPQLWYNSFGWLGLKHQLTN